MSNFPLHPKHPERICWGCEKFCPSEDLSCGNGTIRTPHPIELFGEDWLEWLNEHEHSNGEAVTAPTASAAEMSKPGQQCLPKNQSNQVVTTRWHTP
jgi:hypothetical protein